MFVWYDRLLDTFGKITGALAAFVAVGVALDVMLRILNLGTIPWILEAAEYSLLIIAFLGAPWVLREGAHVSIDVVVNLLSPRAARVAEVIVDIVGLTVCLILSFYAVRITFTSWQRESVIYKEIVLPEWWLLSLLPLCFVLLAVEFGRRLKLSANAQTIRQSTGEGL